MLVNIMIPNQISTMPVTLGARQKLSIQPPRLEPVLPGASAFSTVRRPQVRGYCRRGICVLIFVLIFVGTPALAYAIASHRNQICHRLC